MPAVCSVRFLKTKEGEAAKKIPVQECCNSLIYNAGFPLICFS